MAETKKVSALFIGPFVIEDGRSEPLSDIYEHDGSAELGALLVARDVPHQWAERIVRACNAHDDLLAALKHQIANCPLCKGTGVADQLEVLGYQMMEFQEGDCRRCTDERALIMRIERCSHTRSKAERDHG